MPKAGDHGSYGDAPDDDWGDDELSIELDYSDDDAIYEDNPNPVMAPTGYGTVSGKFGRSGPDDASSGSRRADPADDSRGEGSGRFGKRDRISKKPRDPEDPSSKLKLMKGKKNKVLGAVVVLVGVGLVASQLTKSDDGADPVATDSSEVAEVDQSVFDPNDPPSTIKDNRNGNHDTAVDAIRGYLWEYYINKDAGAARSYYSPDSPVKEADIGAGIDRTVPGMKYNVTITPTGTEVYDVVLTLLTPDGKSQDYQQQYTMMKKNSQFYIQRFTSV